MAQSIKQTPVQYITQYVQLTPYKTDEIRFVGDFTNTFR